MRERELGGVRKGGDGTGASAGAGQERGGPLSNAVLLQQVGLQVLAGLEGLTTHAARHPLPATVHVGHVLLQVTHCAVAAATRLTPRPNLLLLLRVLLLCGMLLRVLPQLEGARPAFIGGGCRPRGKLYPLLVGGGGVEGPQLRHQHRQVEVT